MQELYIDSVDCRVLSSVHLTCRIGERVGVLGRNGSGKSTLLKVIFGSLNPNHMHFKINGELTRKGYLGKKIAYLPQEYFIPPYLQIKTAVALFTNRYKEQLLSLDLIRFNLEEKIAHLSGGNRRLLESLLVIYSDAEYILLDEPFSQLAPLVVDELKSHIFNFKENKGFVITDHYYRHILEVSDRVILIHNGSNYSINHQDDLILHGYLPS